jgi:rod shape-determining protein MreD
MARGFRQRFDRWARNLLPFVVTFLCMLLGMTPFSLPYYAPIAAPLTLMSVFYWVIHRPDLLRPLPIFALGVLYDLISGAPLGMTPFIFISVYWLLIAQRRFFLGRSFTMLWIGFALVALGAALMQWGIFAMIAGRVIDGSPALTQAALGVALFPLAAYAFQRLQRSYLE